MGADFGPSPKTVWVAFLYKWHAVQCLAAVRTADKLGESGGVARLAYSSALVGIYVMNRRSTTIRL
jgi:hypothetical protein